MAEVDVAAVTTTADSARPVVRRRPRRWGNRNRHDYLVFLGFAAPNILLIAAFTYRPLLSNV